MNLSFGTGMKIPKKNATSNPMAYPFLRRSCIKMQNKKMQLLAKTENAKNANMQVAFSPPPLLRTKKKLQSPWLLDTRGA
jgi:hypothetical protein